MILRTHGPTETEALGQSIGSACAGGEIVGLVGELGTGKTCLVRGLAVGLGVEPADIHSPSFTLINEHQGRLRLFHIDLYRLDTITADELWLRECLFGDGVAAVEWFDRLAGMRATDHLQIRLKFAAGEARELELVATGPRHARLLHVITAARGRGSRG